MKISKQKLQNIIIEEINRILLEDEPGTATQPHPRIPREGPPEPAEAPPAQPGDLRWEGAAPRTVLQREYARQGVGMLQPGIEDKIKALNNKWSSQSGELPGRTDANHAPPPNPFEVGGRFGGSTLPIIMYHYSDSEKSIYDVRKGTG